MTARHKPTYVYHFTHVDHLSTVMGNGLLSDDAVHRAALLISEVGNLGIKDNRRRREVPVAPGGMVCDYVPFYFGPRSPMMFGISRGTVPTYREGTSRLVYLVSTLERLVEFGCRPVLTDRNAVYEYAEFRAFDPSDPLDDGFIDWEIIAAKYWTDFPDGRERRMAECLVHERVPWDAFLAVGARTDEVADEVAAVLAEQTRSIPVVVRPHWYF